MPNRCTVIDKNEGTVRLPPRTERTAELVS